MCIILSRALIHLPACSTVAWLYVYDCMVVCVWLYDNVRMMLSWRSQDHIQLVKTCNRQWLRVYEFMLGCLPQIHKQSCQQQDRMVNTKVCKVKTCTLCVCTTSHGNASRTRVRHHCMVLCGRRLIRRPVRVCWILISPYFSYVQCFRRRINRLHGGGVGWGGAC